MPRKSTPIDTIEWAKTSKRAVMLEAVKAMFLQNPPLGRALLATAEVHLSKVPDVGAADKHRGPVIVHSTESHMSLCNMKHCFMGWTGFPVFSFFCHTAA